MRDLILGESLEALIDHRGKTPAKLGSDFQADGVPVASAILVKNGRLDLSDARFVDSKTYARWMGVPTRAGDVLLTSEAPLGRVARVPSDEPLVLGQRLYGLRGREGILDSGYLYYALQTERVRSDLVGRSTGTTVFGIRQSSLRNIVIPAPSFEEQRSIAEVLGALDDKIAGNERVIASADQLATALMQQALVDRSVPLVEVAAVTMGSSPPGTSYNEDGTGMPFYQGVRDFGVRFPTRRVWTTEPVRTAAERDVLLSVRAPVGRTNVANEQLCLGRGVAGLRPRDGRSATLLHQVRAASSAWAPYEAEGTVFGSINKSQLESIEIPAIDPAAADVLEGQLHALEAQIASALAENVKLAAFRDELLPLLMSGKLRVKDIDATVLA
ncbi:restriction endonuclease subunit S [Nocardioides panzhihuensis]|uniref:Type I restriction enzyme S subunit n=1 Tax=Nocardioides panzhihuensis TaxID=860243 RepID=A0A7Z0IVB4_9ACTN|nr:restriction endonuclease subunit S [Nocardioides panzhihuensis]NYI80628.1 type I restriction enzyme S subunit [Nocardioides panzhihuensis]